MRMNDRENEDLFETNDDQDLKEIEGDVTKSIRKKPTGREPIGLKMNINQKSTV